MKQIEKTQKLLKTVVEHIIESINNVEKIVDKVVHIALKSRSELDDDHENVVKSQVE